MDPFAVVAFALLVSVAYLVLRPLLLTEVFEPEGERSSLVAERERLLEAIREFDMDLATGKLSPQDHAALRARYVAETVVVLRAIEDGQLRSRGEEPAADAGDGGEVARADGDEPAAVAASPDLEAALEREVAARKAQLLAPPSPEPPEPAVGSSCCPDPEPVQPAEESLQ